MKNKNGFTLFELLVSISIIAILVAVASTSYSAAQKKARDSRRMEDLNNIQKAAEQYYSSNSYVYPANKASFSPTYLQSWPKGPKLATDYNYTYDVTNNTYCLCVVLDNAAGNSNVLDCTAFVSSGGANYCVKNQQ